MKNLTRLFIVIISLTMTTSAFSQVKFGIKGGLNLANMLDKDEDDTYSDDYKFKPGFHLGVITEFSISKQFAIEPGLLFSTKGFKVEEEDIKLSFNLNYIEMPLNAIYKIDLGGVKILTQTGPYIAYAISGKMKANMALLGVNEDSKEEEILIGDDKEKDVIKPLDFGVNFGAGVEINDFFISMQYGLGLANLSISNDVNDDKTKMKNKVIGVSVGYKFGGNRRSNSFTRM